MARGRFLDKRITQDMRFTRVSTTAYLVYLCITPHLDVEGKMGGDPLVVRNIACGLHPDVLTVNEIGQCLEELNREGIIIWYEVDGVKYLKDPLFLTYQIGLRPQRENKSYCPEPDDARNTNEILGLEGSDPRIQNSELVRVKDKDKDKVSKREVEGKVEEQVEDQVKDAGRIDCDDPTIGEPLPGGTAPRVVTQDSECESLFDDSELSWADQMRERLKQIPTTL